MMDAAAATTAAAAPSSSSLVTAAASAATATAFSNGAGSNDVMMMTNNNGAAAAAGFVHQLTESHRSYVYSLLSDEDRLLFDKIFTHREKLLNEINELEDELSELQNEIEQLDVNDNDNKNNPKSKQISLGKKKFNVDPKQGMKFLFENNLIANTPDAVAEFLYSGQGLNKTAIGTYLGEKDDFNLQVLKKYIGLHDFHSKPLVDSLREFLSNFQLPGESQKIDRIIEMFSERFTDCNPNIISANACYIVSYSTVMLNTILHNPSVKEKKSCDQFIKMCRDCCKDEEVPEQLLRDIYNSIKREQFKLIHNDASEFLLTFNNPIRQGWLFKQGGRYKAWKRRWFILNDGCLYYFESISGKEPKGIIPLENVNVREVDDKTKQFCFEIYSTTNDKIKACKHDSEGKVVEVGNHAVYRMSAQTAEDKNEWIKRIRDCISENPLLNTTSKRKLNNAASAAANITTTNANNNTTSTTTSNNANNTTLINNQHNSMSDSSLAATAAAVAAANNFNSTSSSAAALNGGAHHLTNNNK